VVEAADAVDRLGRRVRGAVPTARHVYIEADVPEDQRRTTTWVTAHSGHLDPDDPRYAAITGRTAAPGDDEDIWVE
jgi:hypothetical protein